MCIAGFVLTEITSEVTSLNGGVTFFDAYKGRTGQRYCAPETTVTVRDTCLFGFTNTGSCPSGSTLGVSCKAQPCDVADGSLDQAICCQKTGSSGMLITTEPLRLTDTTGLLFANQLAAQQWNEVGETGTMKNVLQGKPALDHQLVGLGGEFGSTLYLAGGATADATDTGKVYKLDLLATTNAGVAVEQTTTDDATTFGLHTVTAWDKDADVKNSKDVILFGGFQSATLSRAVRESYLGYYGFWDHRTLGTPFRVAADESSSDKYVFHLDVDSEASGRYSICQCDPQADLGTDGEDLPSTSAQDAAWHFNENKVPTTPTQMTMAQLPASVASDQCFSKCASGCTGSGCFCDGYANGDLATTASLCLDHAGLRAACALSYDSPVGGVQCAGYMIDRSKNRGFLLANGGGLAAAMAAGATDSETQDTWVLVTAKGGSICKQYNRYDTTHTDFISASTVGTMVVTRRADVGVDYVVTPTQETSLEITGDGLRANRDRIMVIDCEGVCGVSQAVTSVTVPSAWHLLGAVDAIVDLPSQEAPAAPITPVVQPDYTYRAFNGRYCPGQNVEIATHTDPLVRNHQCYSKCYLQAPCIDLADDQPHCFCDGHHQGYDGADSTALCLNRTQCQALCSRLGDGCDGIDMSRGENRCFLNLGCAGYAAATEAGGTDPQLAPSETYDFYYREATADPRRRLAVTTAEQARNLLALTDPGISWSRILRFNSLTFTSGGTFKLCLCDSEVISIEPTAHYWAGVQPAFCSQTSDFAVDVGTIHASGLQCLLGDRRFQRGVCESQYWGGLRCYSDGQVPSLTIPGAFPGVPAAGEQESTVVERMEEFCMYGPPEETARFTYCNTDS